MLGCAPSEIKQKHPNLTVRDYHFLIQYKLNEMRTMGEMFGFRKMEGTITKSPRKENKTMGKKIK